MFIFVVIWASCVFRHVGVSERRHGADSRRSGLAIVMRGLAQLPVHAGLSLDPTPGSRQRPCNSPAMFLPLPNSKAPYRSPPSAACGWSSTRPISARARGDDAGPQRGGAGRHRQKQVFALGWGLGAARSSASAGAVLAVFFTSTRMSARPFSLIAYVTVARWGFGSVFRRLRRRHSRWPGRGQQRFILPPSLKYVGIYALYLLVVVVRAARPVGSL